jgi:RNA polymerase sigma-70 factor (ECF subfamily)
VFERFAPLVRRIVRRSLNPDGDVDDAIQEVFASLFEHADQLRAPSAFRAYVGAIAVRTAMLHGRRRRMEARFAQSAEDVEDARMSESNAESRSAWMHFCRLLDQVDARDRAAYVLRYIEEKEVIDVARTLETSVPTARRRFQRAYRRVSQLAERDPSLAEYLSRSSGAFVAVGDPSSSG